MNIVKLINRELNFKTLTKDSKEDLNNDSMNPNRKKGGKK